MQHSSLGRERIERERNAAITRRAAGREIKAPDKYDPSEENKNKRERGNAAADLKAVQVSVLPFKQPSPTSHPNLSFPPPLSPHSPPPPPFNHSFGRCVGLTIL